MKTNKNLGQRTYLLKNFSAPSKTWLFLFDFFFGKGRRWSFFKVSY
jgi:hypothetical protein